MVTLAYAEGIENGEVENGEIENEEVENGEEIEEVVLEVQPLPQPPLQPPLQPLPQKKCNKRDRIFIIAGTSLAIVALTLALVLGNLRLATELQACEHQVCRDQIRVTVTNSSLTQLHMHMQEDTFSCWVETDWRLIVNSTLTIFRSQAGTCCFVPDGKCKDVITPFNIGMVFVGTPATALVSFFLMACLFELLELWGMV